MSTNFQDITIVGLDKNATQPVQPGSDAHNVHIELSASPPSEWIHYFDLAYSSQMVLSQGAANIQGRHIVILCSLSDIQRYQQRLTESVEQANANYAAHLQRDAAHRANEHARREADQRRIDEAADNLNFN